MASKSKLRPTRNKTSPNQLSNLGLLDIPELDADLDLDEDLSDVDESILENELQALMRGETPVKRKKPRANMAPPLDIEKVAAEFMKDDYNDDEDDDEDIFKNEDLLNELKTLTTDSSPSVDCQNTFEEKNDVSNVSTSDKVNNEDLIILLLERQTLYKEAENAAKSNNDISKFRRFNRALKTIENLLKSVRAGLSISQEEIPPVLSGSKPSSETSSLNFSSCPSYTVHGSQPLDNTKRKPSLDDNAEQVSHIELNTSIVSLLITRQNQYKTAALQAKKLGNKEVAIKYLKIAKTFDAVIEAAKKNEPVDLTNIPPEPSTYSSTLSQITEISSQKQGHEQLQTSSSIEIAALAAANDEDQPEIFSAPPAPSTILEALQQRLEKYISTKEAAESEGNSGKARRLQRIVKSYEVAIKNYIAGKEVNFEELPTPPGFSPIPVEKEKSTVQNNPTCESNTLDVRSDTAKPVTPTAESNPPIPSTRKPKIQRSNTSTAEKQLEFLLERQQLFRQAALSAKKNGDIQQAKEYLRMSKGFDSMVEATKCGLPIDVSTIPTPPQLESDFVIVSVSDCKESSNLIQEDLFESLEKDLCRQIETCNKNKDHFLRLGDVSSASKFEKLGVDSKKDLCVIQHLKQKGDSITKFHYETRVFSMVICNADLNDNELEVNIKRGIQLPGKPDDLDSFVKIELPIPSEAPQRAKTHTIRDTNNPVFEEKFKFEINRKSRTQLRLFKRHNLKLEVWSKGGFLRSDNLLGTCSIKLIDLEAKCTIHDSFNLMDGRKICGGKLEAEVRLRDPLLVKQVEEVREKWLVIGS